jgi:hypothetical protein
MGFCRPEIMTYTLSQAGDKDAGLWDDIVGKSPHGTIFHTWKWLKITGNHSGMKFYPFILFQGEKIVALYPVYFYQGRVFRIAYSPPPKMNLTYMGPVIVDYDLLPQYRKERLFAGIQECLDTYLFETLGCSMARIHPSPGLSDARPLIWAGYTVNTWYTYQLDLTVGLEPVWNNFHSKLKALINRSMRRGVTVREGDESDLRRIIDELMRRQGEDREGRPGVDNPYYHHIFREFRDKMKIFLADYQDRPVGNVVVLLDRDMARCWMGTPKFHEKGISGNDVVCWEAMKWAHDHGFRRFENMDAGYKQELATFKSRFNMVPVIWFEGKKYASGFWRLATSALGRGTS